jgi:hypothetical protein
VIALVTSVSACSTGLGEWSSHSLRCGLHVKLDFKLGLEEALAGVHAILRPG